MKVKQYIRATIYNSCCNKIRYGHEDTAERAAKMMEEKYLPYKISLVRV